MQPKLSASTTSTPLLQQQLFKLLPRLYLIERDLKQLINEGRSISQLANILFGSLLDHPYNIDPMDDVLSYQKKMINDLYGEIPDIETIFLILIEIAQHNDLDQLQKAIKDLIPTLLPLLPQWPYYVDLETLQRTYPNQIDFEKGEYYILEDGTLYYTTLPFYLFYSKQANSWFILENELLGKGSYGKTNRMLRIDRGNIALIPNLFNVINPDKIEALKRQLLKSSETPVIRLARLEQLSREYKAQQALSGPDKKTTPLTPHKKCTKGATHTTFWLRKEYAQGLNLRNFLANPSRELTFENKIVIILQIVNQLERLAKIGMSHMDVKSINIILNPTTAIPTAKVIDAGLATPFGQKPLSLNAPWFAPEGISNPKFDVFSLGLLCYDLLGLDMTTFYKSVFLEKYAPSGNYLVTSSDLTLLPDAQTIIQTLQSKYSISQILAERTSALIQKMICYNVSERVSFYQVSGILNEIIANLNAPSPQPTSSDDNDTSSNSSLLSDMDTSVDMDVDSGSMRSPEPPEIEMCTPIFSMGNESTGDFTFRLFGGQQTAAPLEPTPDLRCFGIRGKS